MILVTQGLRITTDSRYIKFSKGSKFNTRLDINSSCLYIEFPIGQLTTEMSSPYVEVLVPGVLVETNYIKVINPVINLNGLELEKYSLGDYNYSQLIVEDIDEFIMNFDSSYCQVLIPKTQDWNINKFIGLLQKNPFIGVKNYSKLRELTNFYQVNIRDKNREFTSSNKFKFNTKTKYTKYLLDPITVESEFIDNIRTIAEEYGLELIRLPIDQNTNSLHKLTYRFTEISKQDSHKSDSNPLRYAVSKVDRVEFKLSTPDLSIYNDFKTRYQNLDILSNFTEFYTNDKLGRSWISNVNWQPADTSFQQDYQQDENGNIAFELSFSCELGYYTVYDETYYNIQEMILSIIGKDTTTNTVVFKA